MQFIQAKKGINKLSVRDNRAYAIDQVEFTNYGFALLLTDFEGKKVYLSYSSLDDFKDEFAIVNSVYDLERYMKYNEEDW